MTAIPIDKLCRAYIRMREKKQELTRVYDEEVGKLDKDMEFIAGAMKDILVETGGTSLKTAHGTVYLQNKTKYYPRDWHAFNEWVVENRVPDLFEKRVSQGNMKKWLEEHPANVPPGLQSETKIEAVVRKS